MHIPVYVVQIVSFAYLDKLMDNSTSHLERMIPQLDINRYYALWKGVWILTDEYEQRLIRYYGVDLGQVSKKVNPDE